MPIEYKDSYNKMDEEYGDQIYKMNYCYGKNAKVVIISG